MAGGGSSFARRLGLVLPCLEVSEVMVLVRFQGARVVAADDRV